MTFVTINYVFGGVYLSINSPEARTLKEGFRTMIGSEKV